MKIKVAIHVGKLGCNGVVSLSTVQWRYVGQTYCTLTTSANIRDIGNLQLHPVATCNRLMHNLQCVLV
jgi:hypothetical protein